MHKFQRLTLQAETERNTTMNPEEMNSAENNLPNPVQRPVVRNFHSGQQVGQQVSAVPSQLANSFQQRPDAPVQNESVSERESDISGQGASMAMQNDNAVGENNSAVGENNSVSVQTPSNVSQDQSQDQDQDQAAAKQNDSDSLAQPVAAVNSVESQFPRADLPCAQAPANSNQSLNQTGVDSRYIFDDSYEQDSYEQAGSARKENTGAKAKRSQKRRGPSWAAFISGMVITALMAVVVSVGVMGLRYDGTRPSALKTPAASVEPVVETDGKTPNWEAVAKAVGSSVVAIEAQTSAGGASGSGVIIDQQGHVLTNDHVISGAQKLWVKLSDGRLFDAKLDGTDAATDLAVISLINPPSNLSIAALGNSSELQVGEAVAAIGNPLGLSSTMTSGIISALDRPVQTLNREAQNFSDARVVTNAIQLDAAVNPGNSGGPVFDAEGRVIGIASSIATTGTSEGDQGGSIGLGFAIPIDLARNIAQQLIQNGVAEHAYLGVTIRDGVANYGAEQRLGAQIDSVQADTPAAKAKLRAGDVVVAVDGRNVVSAVSLTGYIRQYQSGESVTLTIARNGELQDLDVVLATKPDQ